MWRITAPQSDSKKRALDQIDEMAKQLAIATWGKRFECRFLLASGAQPPSQHSNSDDSKSDGSDDSNSDDADGSDDVDDDEENEAAEVQVVRRMRRPKSSTPNELKKDAQTNYQAIDAVQAALSNIGRGALQYS